MIKEAEDKDNFQEACKKNYVNSLVRYNHSYTIDSNSYIDTINSYVSQYPIFNNINIIQLDPSAENGYPHTRLNIICIPSNARFPSLEKTLFHEVVHIHQRNNPNLWNHFLNKEGWFLESKEIIPERWREKCRLNPDTYEKQFWSFQKHYIPLPLYLKDSFVKFEDIKVMYYDLKTGILEHSPPKIITNKYGNISQPEHPYEIYAVILAETYPFTEEKIKQFLIDGRI